VWPASAVILLSCFAAGLTRRLRACARPAEAPGQSALGAAMLRQRCARPGLRRIRLRPCRGQWDDCCLFRVGRPLQQACLDNAMRAPAYVSFPHAARDMRGRNTFTNTPLPTATRCTTHAWEKPRSRFFGGVGFGGLGRALAATCGRSGTSLRACFPLCYRGETNAAVCAVLSSPMKELPSL